MRDLTELEQAEFLHAARNHPNRIGPTPVSEMAWQRINLIVDTLNDTYQPAAIIIWLATPNKRLDNQRPVELVSDIDRVDQVLAEARRIANA